MTSPPGATGAGEPGGARGPGSAGDPGDSDLVSGPGAAAGPPVEGLGGLAGGPPAGGPRGIPLSYRLREGVRVEQVRGEYVAVSEVPLAVLRVTRSAARLLESTRAGARVADLAAALSTDEERIVSLCERFRGRGMLDVEACADLETDEDAPSVSVIVPTKDRAAELDDCLAALFALDYPRGRLEVIVVDDGSRDSTPEVAGRYPCVYLANERNRGQSYARNAGARVASGEILAFIDSDCVASPRWLRELVPFFAWPGLAGVGGYVAGYHDRSALDRYERSASSLNMGDRLIVMTVDRSMAYVPTCNLLVRKEAYLAVGGLREDLRVGEDVDLCWRLRAAGSDLVYAPTGIVSHRHRNTLRGMLARRAAYGTSEAVLHALHPEKRKTIRVRPLTALSAALVGATLTTVEPWLLPFCLVPLAGDCVRASVRLARSGVRVRRRTVWSSTARTHLSFLYSASYHLVRYYLVLVVAGGLAAPGLWLLAAAAVGWVTVVDYRVRRPRLAYPVFLWFSVAEHVAYQTGVFVGCLKRRSFRSYRLSLGRAGRSGLAGRSGREVRTYLRLRREPTAR